MDQLFPLVFFLALVAAVFLGAALMDWLLETWQARRAPGH